ncbi:MULTISPECIES: hypothetical protein [unclassified Nostoc]|jgi:hypothetical protein|uniref:hypothetical protein n=1 Tax=unclassified Nostoc TaxID=2593658 RepID=UPI0015C36F39|nr:MULTISPECIES: hypothetical protein [unclassified Nostoc]MBD2505880.1 hypothetical protein [Desmonostoc muscorum FACHB-395]MBD2524041.1 hypothetical protein [Nostoc sp. FACHB-133]QLE51572.1 hypothetical protein FD724_28260 [Nostoc sp. C057]
MASIALSQLNTTGSELFQDSESFLNDLNNVDSITVYGGGNDISSVASGLGPLLAYGVKGQEFALLGFGASLTAHIVKSFSDVDTHF